MDRRDHEESAQFNRFSQQVDQSIELVSIGGTGVALAFEEDQSAAILASSSANSSSPFFSRSFSLLSCSVSFLICTISILICSVSRLIFSVSSLIFSVSSLSWFGALFVAELATYFSIVGCQLSFASSVRQGGKEERNSCLLR